MTEILPLLPMICFVKIIFPTLLKTCIEQLGRMAFLPLWAICPAVVNTEVRDGTSLGASGLKRGKQCVRAFKIRRKHGGKVFFVKVHSACEFTAVGRSAVFQIQGHWM